MQLQTANAKMDILTWIILVHNVLQFVALAHLMMIVLLVRILQVDQGPQNVSV